MSLPAFIHRPIIVILQDLQRGWVTRVLLALALLGGAWLLHASHLASLPSHLLLGGIAAALLLIISAPALRNWLQNRSIVGYWACTGSAKHGGDGHLENSVQIPTLVHIYQQGVTLKLAGYNYGAGAEQYFLIGEAMISNPFARQGRFTYWYQAPSTPGTEPAFHGIANLEWQRSTSQAAITQMQGSFCGVAKNHIGHLDFQRIAKRQFDQLLGHAGS